MDNQTIDVSSRGANGIAHALAIIWDEYDEDNSRARAVAYKVIPATEKVEGLGWSHNPKSVDTMILLWHESEEGCTPFPSPLNMEQSAMFLNDWLAQAEYPREPDQDGSNEKGWRLFTESWGHVYGHRYAIIGAQPQWMMYGK